MYTFESRIRYSEINEQLQNGFEGQMQTLMSNPQVQAAQPQDTLPAPEE